MIPAIYFKDTDYILSCATVTAQVAAIDAIKTALLVQMLNVASNGQPVTEYTLSDGQTHIKANYQTVADIEKSINALDYMRNRITNNAKGRTTRGIDIKNFIGRWGW
jgi:hypothetical protein